MAASRLFSFGSRRAASWFPRLQWGWLAAIAGAHAAGLFALSALESGEPVRSAEPVLVVRLLPPAGPVPVPPQADPALRAPARAAPPAHDVAPTPAPEATTPGAAPPRPAPASDAARSAPKSPRLDAHAPAKSATKPPAQVRSPEPPREKPAEAAVEGKTRDPQRDAPVAQPAPVAPSPAATESTAVSAPQSPLPSVAQPDAQAAVAHPSHGASPTTEARFDAAYLSNPAPSYPRVSRRRGEEGRVLLRVRVLAGGTAGAVEIAEGSGHSRLDAAARDAVRGWRFVPASRGDVTIDSWLNVPIVFRLEN